MNRCNTCTRHSLFSAIQLSACCWLTQARCNKGCVYRPPHLPCWHLQDWNTSHSTWQMCTQQYTLRRLRVSSDRPQPLDSTRGSTCLSGCLLCVQVRGDKIIVFSDNIFSLRNYAVVLKKPFIYGGTSHAERTRVLHAFKHNPQVSYPPCSIVTLASHLTSCISTMQKPVFTVLRRF